MYISFNSTRVKVDNRDLTNISDFIIVGKIQELKQEAREKKAIDFIIKNRDLVEKLIGKDNKTLLEIKSKHKKVDLGRHKYQTVPFTIINKESIY